MPGRGKRREDKVYLDPVRPELQQQRDFLFQIYFGRNGDELDRFISRAYRDLNRTFRGIGKLDDELKTHILNNAKEELKRRIVTLSEDKDISLDRFNAWHNGACNALKNYYEKSLNAKIRFTYGQAQKWINMTMKYCWVCGGRLDGLQQWFPMAHVAVDEVILIAALEEKVVTNRPCVKWSKWDNEKEYKDFQFTLRNVTAKKNKVPLELEFEWWEKYRSKLTRVNE
jgi:hypothetical protein